MIRRALIAILASGFTLSNACDYLCTTAQAQESSSTSHNWHLYSNTRFHYTICYPDDVFTSQEESDTRDGKKFDAPDGSELIVYGNNNTLSRSIQSESAAAASELAGTTGEVTYKAIKANWFVISGQTGNTIFYTKTFYNERDDQFKSFVLTYNKSSASFYEPLISHIASCFSDNIHH